MTHKLQSTLEASGIDWPALKNHIPCMAHVIHLALGAFMRSLGLKGRTMSSEAHEHDQQFGENESINIGKSQRLRKEGNARINKVSAMIPGLGKIIEKVRISWYFESPEADLHLAENVCPINYANTWSPKRVHSLSKNPSQHYSYSKYGCEDRLELYSGVARARLPLPRIHLWVASTAKIQWISAAIHNSRRKDEFRVCHGSIESILILDPLDVKEAYSQIPSRYHSVQWHVRSHGWCYGSIGQAEDPMEQRLVLRCEVSSTEVFQILRRSHSSDGHTADWRTYPRSFPEVEII